MALSLEKLLADGFTRDDIMKLADSGAFGSVEEKEDKEGNKESENTDNKEKEANKETSSDPMTAALSMITKMMENQNAMILKMLENKTDAKEGEEKEESAEEKARKFSDEQLTKALQSLNILKDGDKIDIGTAVEKNIENKILGKLGAAVGFSVKEKDDKEEGK